MGWRTRTPGRSCCRWSEYDADDNDDNDNDDDDDAGEGLAAVFRHDDMMMIQNADDDDDTFKMKKMTIYVHD